MHYGNGIIVFTMIVNSKVGNRSFSFPDPIVFFLVRSPRRPRETMGSGNENGKCELRIAKTQKNFVPLGEQVSQKLTRPRILLFEIQLTFPLFIVVHLLPCQECEVVMNVTCPKSVLVPSY